MSETIISDPHRDSETLIHGPSPESSAATMILLHGRGGSALGMLELFKTLGTDNVAAIIPQAHDRTWYPYSFLVPLAENQPYFTSAIARVDSVITDLVSRGVPRQKIIILGFSQGACLATEYVARHPRRYGAVVALSGGFFGPSTDLANYHGSLDSTPVFMGAVDPDSHVPFERVQETALILNKLGADVEMRRYPGLPHSVNQDELNVCRNLVDQVISASFIKTP